MTQIKGSKNHDELVKSWWRNKFRNKLPSLYTFLKAIDSDKIQMSSSGSVSICYQIFEVIDENVLLVKSSSGAYFLLYLKYREFIRLIFPFDKDYTVIFEEEVF